MRVFEKLPDRLDDRCPSTQLKSTTKPLNSAAPIFSFLYATLFFDVFTKSQIVKFDKLIAAPFRNFNSDCASYENQMLNTIMCLSSTWDYQSGDVAFML
jgi:hypothetical protein